MALGLFNCDLNVMKGVEGGRRSDLAEERV